MMRAIERESLHVGSGARLRFSFGVCLAVLILAGLAEVHLRFFPPSDLYPYLGEESPLTGVHASDPDFVMGYTSWEAFTAENAARLKAHLSPESWREDRPIWALFGNSFVQAPGMLGDTARAALPDHTFVYLGRNEHPPIRMAQIKLLLRHGLRPDRIIFAVMPVDVIGMGSQPLETYHLTQRGALTYSLPSHGPLVDWFTHGTRIGLTACVRSGWHLGNPTFRRGGLYHAVPEPLRKDLTRLFHNLARICRNHAVPVTVLLIPDYYQICHNRPYAFQNFLREMLGREGIDVCDPREEFRSQPDREALFIPDRHFSDRGNQVLLSALLRHLSLRTTPISTKSAESVP